MAAVTVSSNYKIHRDRHCKIERNLGKMGHLYALDFDGVLCDTCGETAISAVKAAKLRWPALFDGVDPTVEDWIVQQMITVRPVVETGYETLLLVRLLLETRVPSIRKSSVAEGLTVEGILETWIKLKPIVMEEWDENRDELIDLFGKVRDDWLQNDFSGWMEANRFYPGTADALRFASSKVYIVTTKQGRFADALLKELAGITLPPERIYGLGTGSAKEASKDARAPRTDPTLIGGSTLRKREMKQQLAPGLHFLSCLTSIRIALTRDGNVADRSTGKSEAELDEADDGTGVALHHLLLDLRRFHFRQIGGRERWLLLLTPFLPRLVLFVIVHVIKHQK
ncbi:hypothetical protein Ahy_A04g018189 isoform B [Arachis hypogaea]|uniref:Uncharacterized protein n=1 Tax=Arachis hypogaea TaxID=3818 RepID=A0A445DD30_ARAHY|nr:hypothetical protein Ahy_A04g018189 isoform B [Arachis hypogaea]